MRAEDQDQRSRTDDDYHYPDEDDRIKVRHSPRTGTKISLVVGLSLLATAVYFVVAPVFMDTANGWFGCGSVLSGSDSEFVNNVCGNATEANLYKALLAGVLALLVGGLGSYLFGFDRSEVTQSDESTGHEMAGRPSRARRRDQNINLRDYGRDADDDDDWAPVPDRRGRTRSRSEDDWDS